jgi:hypothetical protein
VALPCAEVGRSIQRLSGSGIVMVTVKFSELLDAFEFASFNGPVENRVFIDRETGAFHFISDEIEFDEEVPADIEDSDRYLAVPHKNDLDLGRRLAMSFVEQFLRNDYDAVEAIFHKRGAYGRFKDLLDRHGVLDAWYKFETEATEQALKRWCQDKEIQLSFS